MAASFLTRFMVLLSLSVQCNLGKFSNPPRSHDSSRDQDFPRVPSVDCSSPPQSSLLFCQTGADPMRRAEDLVSRLTLGEVISQTSTMAPAIPRFGIKDYNWRSNCLHGWSLSGGFWDRDLKWTVFPAPIGLGATFDEDLIRKLADVTGVEGRALHNEMLAMHNGSSTEAAGLNCFAPNVNLFRDPRWGRGQETFGEDPYLISVIGNAYTLGLQNGTRDSENEGYLKIAACAKHYTVHSGPEETRMHFAANVSLHDLYDTYLPAFKSQVIGAKVSMVMPAYSALNCTKQDDSAPDAASPFLRKVLRDDFSAPNISVCSDNGGIAAVYTDHHYVSSREMAAAVCMNATTDLDLGWDLVYTLHLQSAVTHGLVDEGTIRKSVTRNFYLRMLVGDFDPPNKVAYQRLDKTSLDTSYNREVNLQAARESIVLLKKTKLPLKVLPSTKRIAVIGPNANDSRVMLSSYEGIPSSIVTILQGIQNHVRNSSTVVEYMQGCDVVCANMSNFVAATNMARQADHVVMVMGLSNEVEGENHDRKQTTCEDNPVPLLGLPGCQSALVELIADIAPNVIVVLINGGPVSIQALHYHDGVVGIIEAFYPGAVGGTAVADVLFGNYNPGGRMPVSVYPSTAYLPPVESYDMSTFPGRTYRYSAFKPLYPFGFGLSYSDVGYLRLLTPEIVEPCMTLVLSVWVENNTPEDLPGADEVVMVYLRTSEETLQSYQFLPKIRLVGFSRKHLVPNRRETVPFEITPYQMSLAGSDGVHYIYPGVYTVVIGTLEASVEIPGKYPVEIASCTDSRNCLAC